MKRAIIAVIAALVISLGVNAQSTVTKQGNLFVESPKKSKIARDSTTSYTFVDANGTKYPVYVGSKGGLYYYPVVSGTRKGKKYIHL